MTRNEILLRFPHASEDFLQSNATPDYSPGPDSFMERPLSDESLEKDCRKKEAAVRIHIRFISVRKRLCDPDNLSAKWLLDCLRYCKAVAGDEPDKITLEIAQCKAEKGEREHTIIEII